MVVEKLLTFYIHCFCGINLPVVLFHIIFSKNILLKGCIPSSTRRVRFVWCLCRILWYKTL